ncbi:MAG TPA: DUF192 domain-containing protein [Solirubrobacterales bacterium]|nr:DUF192 domain-containing protein [Solirubrobacterales bacterium]
MAALPRREVLGIEVPEASGFRSRLRGLAGVSVERAGNGLLIPRCASIHTFGMRFPLDLFFLDRDGEPLAVRRGVPARRFFSARDAVAVLEVPAARGPGQSV